MRSDKDVSLSSIDPLKSEKDKCADSDMQRCTSLSTQEIMNNYVTAELIQELKVLNEGLDSNNKVTKNRRDKWSKKVYAKCIKKHGGSLLVMMRIG